jgi:hypothetical protein
MSSRNRTVDRPMNFTRSFAITPSDSVDLDEDCWGLLVTGTGDLAFELADDDSGDTTALTSVNANVMISGLKIRKVLSTGTTATVRGLS